MRSFGSCHAVAFRNFALTGSSCVSRREWLATWNADIFPKPEAGDQQRIRKFIRSHRPSCSPALCNLAVAACLRRRPFPSLCSSLAPSLFLPPSPSPLGLFRPSVEGFSFRVTLPLESAHQPQVQRQEVVHGRRCFGGEGSRLSAARAHFQNFERGWCEAPGLRV